MEVISIAEKKEEQEQPQEVKKEEQAQPQQNKIEELTITLRVKGNRLLPIETSPKDRITKGQLVQILEGAKQQIFNERI